MAEPTTGVRFAGVLRDGSGNLITSGVTANSYDIGTTTPTRGTEDSTFTSGKFGISDSGFGRFDVKIVNGSEQIWWSSLAEVQVTSLQARNPTTASAALEVFSTTSEASSLVAVFGFRPSTESSGAETADTPSDGDKGYINFELSNDATSKEQWVAGRLEWEGVDVSNGSEDGQLNLWTMAAGTLREKLHLDNSALWPEADGSDASYGVSLGTAALGFHDLHLGSGGIINLDGGDVTLTHSSGTLTYGGDGAVSVAFGANVDLQFTGGTGTNEIVLANGLADALSITDGSADVIAISTAGGTNTVAITGDLTVSGTIAADTAAVATTVTITDNEDTDEANAIIFTSGGDVDGGNIGLESDGTLNYNPSTGTLTSTVFVGNLTGNASGTAATVTGGTQASITTVANVVEVGALDAGSITSNFGTINTGSSNITTSGTIAGGPITGTTIDATTDFTIGDTVVTNGVITDTSGLQIAAAVDLVANTLTTTGSLQVRTIDYSDGDLAMTIADGGGVTFAQTVTVGVDDTGKDVKFFGASAGAYMEWDESEDQLRIMGASADATTSTGKLLLATSLTDINANDVLGKIDFQAPHEAGGTDAITVAASIQAIAQGTFSGSVNATDMIFYTGHSEAATEKFRFTSQGELGIGGANYGTDGQVLTSTGAGTAPAWEDASGGGSTSWDAVAAASGGDYTTIQAADDALDAATTGYSLFVKGQQEYAEDVTISTHGAYIFIEGGTTLDGDWTISGNNCHVVVGPGSTIEGAWVLSGTGNTVEFGGGTSWTGNGTLSGVGGTLRIGGNTAHVGINTMSANSCSIYCGNGTETDGLVVTGLSCLFDGGGYYTTIDGGTARTAVAVTGGHGFRISNCGVENTRDQGNAYDGITLTDTAVFKIDNVHVHQSDRYGINATSTSAYRGQISNVYMDACNDGGVYVDMARVVMNNVIVSDSSLFGTVTGYGDNTSIVGCQSSNISTSSPLTIDTNAENCVFVGNRMDGSITDNSGTSTVASNDSEAI